MIQPDSTVSVGLVPLCSTRTRGDFCDVCGQVAIERTHGAANQCLRKAETLLMASTVGLSNAQRQTLSDIIDCVTRKWQNLVQCAEERHKLVTASLNFYKTAEQVPRLFCDQRYR